MRAAVITELAGLPSVADRPEPRPAEGEVGMTVEVVALNPVDVAIAAGKFYAGHPPLPFVPCVEGVGRLDDGRLVYAQGGGRGIAVDGFAAERATVPEATVIELPEGTDVAMAVALGTAGLAGWLSVRARGGATAGDRVVVLGATGAVGTVALQAARLAGVDRVVAVGRSSERLELAAAFADATVGLDAAGFAAAVEQAAGGPPTLVVDMLWGDPLAAVLGVLAPGARVVNVGASAGPESTLASAAVRGKQLDVRGYSNFGVARPALVDAYRELLGLAASGVVQLPLDERPLAGIADAWASARSGGTKVVVRVGAGR